MLKNAPYRKLQILMFPLLTAGLGLAWSMTRITTQHFFDAESYKTAFTISSIGVLVAAIAGGLPSRIEPGKYAKGRIQYSLTVTFISLLTGILSILHFCPNISQFTLFYSTILIIIAVYSEQMTNLANATRNVSAFFHYEIINYLLKVSLFFLVLEAQALIFLTLILALYILAIRESQFYCVEQINIKNHASNYLAISLVSLMGFLLPVFIVQNLEDQLIKNFIETYIIANLVASYINMTITKISLSRGKFELVWIFIILIFIIVLFGIFVMLHLIDEQIKLSYLPWLIFIAGKIIQCSFHQYLRFNFNQQESKQFGHYNWLISIAILCSLLHEYQSDFFNYNNVLIMAGLIPLVGLFFIGSRNNET